MYPLINEYVLWNKMVLEYEKPLERVQENATIEIPF